MGGPRVDALYAFRTCFDVMGRACWAERSGDSPRVVATGDISVNVLWTGMVCLPVMATFGGAWWVSLEEGGRGGGWRRVYGLSGESLLVMALMGKIPVKACR